MKVDKPTIRKGILYLPEEKETILPESVQLIISNHDYCTKKVKGYSEDIYPAIRKLVADNWEKNIIQFFLPMPNNHIKGKTHSCFHLLRVTTKKKYTIVYRFRGNDKMLYLTQQNQNESIGTN